MKALGRIAEAMDRSRNWVINDALKVTSELRKENPRLGHPDRVGATRALVVPAYRNYILVYEINGHRVHILAVMYGRQQLA